MYRQLHAFPTRRSSDLGLDREKLIGLALRVVNGVLEDKPEDLVVTTHLCRGNYRSKWAFEGSYAKIAPVLFAKERSEEHTSELQSRGHLVCRLLLEKKK